MYLDELWFMHFITLQIACNSTMSIKLQYSIFEYLFNYLFLKAVHKILFWYFQTRLRVLLKTFFAQLWYLNLWSSKSWNLIISPQCYCRLSHICQFWEQELDSAEKYPPQEEWRASWRNVEEELRMHRDAKPFKKLCKRVYLDVVGRKRAQFFILVKGMTIIFSRGEMCTFNTLRHG